MQQCDLRVLKALRAAKAKGITFDNFRTGWRLGAYIHSLRKKGYDIKTTLEPNFSGSGQHARYNLIGEPK